MPIPRCWKRFGHYGVSETQVTQFVGERTPYVRLNMKLGRWLVIYQVGCCFGKPVPFERTEEESRLRRLNNNKRSILQVSTDALS